MFGPHLTLDCRGCNKDKLYNLQHIFNVLDQLPDLMGMTKITQPYVFPYSGLIPEDRGVTGFVVIAESHLAIHTFPEKDYMFCDIFSCRPFDVEAAIDFIVEAFEVGDYNVNCLERGKDFPR